jgi:Haem-NO-binding
MHGVIFSELKKYVDERLGESAWPKLLDAAGFSGRIFMPVATYPDADAVTLITTAVKVTGLTADGILEDFGCFIVPDLVKLYGHLLDPSWTTLDVIEHTEETIHSVVRSRNPGAAPPELHCSRPSKDEVVIRYSSPRRMCAIAKGIARGLANHFKESVVVSESACMLKGAQQCRITVRSA